MEPKVILLVEDNPSDVDLTRRAFQKSHIANRLIVAEDGRQALDYLLESCCEPARLPALILLDLKLPLVDGLEVLRQIREDRRTRRLPIVILTSSDEESDLAAAYDLGANSYIQKPVDFKRFAEAVRSLGLYWLVLNESPPVEKP
jgi:CheY-like chemotaxis protein